MHEPKLLNPDAAATWLSISRSALYPLLLSGEIESVKIGKSRRITIQALEAYVERLPRTTKPTTGGNN